MASSEDQETPEHEDPGRAVFYALHNSPYPLTFEMLMDRNETHGYDEDAIREGIKDRHLATVEYGDETAYYLEQQESTVHVTIDREMYERLRDVGFYIGDDPYGVDVHLSEDFQSVGRTKSPEDSPEWDTWAPIFPLEDDDEIDQTETTTAHSSKNVLLEATPDDVVRIVDVHEGMWRVPEKMRVVRRTNTYHGPSITLMPPEDWVGERTNYELTCPDKFSDLVLWKAVTDHEGFIQKWTKVARVTAEIFNVAGYDFCEECGDPIKDPMHRSMAMMGMCPGGMNETDPSDTETTRDGGRDE